MSNNFAYLLILYLIGLIYNQEFNVQQAASLKLTVWPRFFLQIAQLYKLSSVFNKIMSNVEYSKHYPGLAYSQKCPTPRA